ncbi:uncharacterized protein BDR25DRAFT_306793 [Lindgomyces ingoldianus]|uniref:Uncharacterized protein n=1 Tax=Lindgomyces ingoldianus TaxID=673940 RepID=A0ACB6QDT1_9PLEO|nr:uncharacterized protein BDR25DRAFT_306793 [Lindgomyces ingoldianus]KAF2465133.1 hypothetical protein BDR25DRAFT_306793 [Lindgomyces ingoldianus]
MWAEAEFATVILVGCFPAFPRLFKFLSGKDRDPKKYSYASDQKSNSGRNSAAPRVSINTPYHWQITTGTTSVGSYYPLEERTRKGGVADETRNEADPRRVHVVSQFLTV